MTIKAVIKPQDFLGREVTVFCKDREETEYHGILAFADQTALVINYSDHGREFSSLIPMPTVSCVSTKLVPKE